MESKLPQQTPIPLMANSVKKESLNSMVFLNQIDRKFLLTTMDGILYILDQHAVDERIQVEKLSSILFGTSGTERNVNNKWIDCLRWEISSSERQLLEKYKFILEKWGIVSIFFTIINHSVMIFFKSRMHVSMSNSFSSNISRLELPFRK